MDIQLLIVILGVVVASFILVRSVFEYNKRQTILNREKKVLQALLDGETTKEEIKTTDADFESDGLLPYKLVLTVIKWTLISMDSGLIATIIEKIKTAIRPSDVDQNTIIGIMVGQKFKSYTKGYISALLSLIAYLSITHIQGAALNGWVLLIIYSLIAAIYINQKTLEYRIRKGDYGSTEYEAREIISFVLAHSQKTDFIDKDGMKKLMPDPETELQDGTIIDGAQTI